MKKQEFFKMVVEEVEHLKKHATKKEIDKLDFEKFDPDNRGECIYGQMTGDCHSDRAIKLTKKCFYDLPLWESPTFSQIKREGHLNKGDWATALEVYITLKGAKNKSLIDYLKGNKDSWKP